MFEVKQLLDVKLLWVLQKLFKLRVHAGKEQLQERGKLAAIRELFKRVSESNRGAHICEFKFKQSKSISLAQTQSEHLHRRPDFLFKLDILEGTTPSHLLIKLGQHDTFFHRTLMAVWHSVFRASAFVAVVRVDQVESNCCALRIECQLEKSTERPRIHRLKERLNLGNA